jgi:uncharacterized protein YfaT (DUF1175 family)
VNQTLSRRRWLGWAGGALAGTAMAPAQAAAAADAAPLSPLQAAAFRRWLVAIVNDQIDRPSPRWVHRDCAGLVRFAVREAWRPHDLAWRQAMGWSPLRPTPPEPAPTPAQAAWTGGWRGGDGQRSAFVSAAALVQYNCVAVGMDRTLAQPGDLLYFDQGDDQHLMVWTGQQVAYHTGAEPRPDDNGLRRQRWDALMQWPDTRWRPRRDNPNFAGLFRLAFLPALGSPAAAAT